jgi:hypothetical protein
MSTRTGCPPTPRDEVDVTSPLLEHDQSAIDQETRHTSTTFSPTDNTVNKRHVSTRTGCPPTPRDEVDVTSPLLEHDQSAIDQETHHTSTTLVRGAVGAATRPARQHGTAAKQARQHHQHYQHRQHRQHGKRASNGTAAKQARGSTTSTVINTSTARGADTPVVVSSEI